MESKAKLKEKYVMLNMNGISSNSLLVTFSKSIFVIFLSWLFSSNLAKRNTWSTHLEEYSKKGSGNGPVWQNNNHAIVHQSHFIHRYRRARSNYNHSDIETKSLIWSDGTGNQVSSEELGTKFYNQFQ